MIDEYKCFRRWSEVNSLSLHSCVYCRTVQTHQQNFNINDGIYPTRCPYRLALSSTHRPTRYFEFEVSHKWERKTPVVKEETERKNEKRNAVCRANVNNWRPNIKRIHYAGTKHLKQTPRRRRRRLASLSKLFSSCSCKSRKYDDKRLIIVHRHTLFIVLNFFISFSFPAVASVHVVMNW